MLETRLLRIFCVDCMILATFRIQILITTVSADSLLFLFCFSIDVKIVRARNAIRLKEALLVHRYHFVPTI